MEQNESTIFTEFFYAPKFLCIKLGHCCSNSISALQMMKLRLIKLMDMLKLTKLLVVDQGLISSILSPEYAENDRKGWSPDIISPHSSKWYTLEVGLKSLSIHNRTTVTLHFPTPTSQPQRK